MPKATGPPPISVGPSDPYAMRHWGHSVISMARVLDTSETGPGITRLRVDAPRVARHWRAGQFVIIRPTADSQRIPLTIAAANPTAGWIEVIVQAVGRPTTEIARTPRGGELADVVRPLRLASEVERFGHVVVVGG